MSTATMTTPKINRYGLLTGSENSAVEAKHGLLLSKQVEELSEVLQSSGDLLKKVKVDPGLNAQGRLEAMRRISQKSVATIAELTQKRIKALHAGVEREQKELDAHFTATPKGISDTERLRREMRDAEVRQVIRALDPAERDIGIRSSADPDVVRAVANAPKLVRQSLGISDEVLSEARGRILKDRAPEQHQALQTTKTALAWYESNAKSALTHLAKLTGISINPSVLAEQASG